MILDRCHDVVVVGGGPAGFAAAVGAAREGADVLLVEASGLIGGMATSGMVPHFNGFADATGERIIIKGVAGEVVSRLVEYSASPGYLKSPTHLMSSVIVPFQPDAAKLVFEEILTEAGAKLQLYSLFVDVLKDRRGKVAGVIVQSKSGRMAIPAKVVVDATGDGDVAVMAGADFVKGRQGDGHMLPVTVMFKIGNVKWGKVLQYMKEHPDQFHSSTPLKIGIDPSVINERTTSAAGFFDIVAHAKANGDLYETIDRIVLHCTPRKGEFEAQMTRVVGIDITDVDDLTKAELIGRKQVMQAVNFLQKYIPGCEECYLLATAPALGVRESRHILGEYWLTGEDLAEGRKFEDAIASSGCPVDIHNPNGPGFTFTAIGGDGVYDIPYRCLVPARLEGVLLAGRCISGDHVAHGSFRQMPACMATGQAAGVAAAMAAMSGVGVRDVDIRTLQDRLVKQGANISSYR